MMALRSYLSPIIDQGTPEAPDLVPLVTTLLIAPRISWGSDDVLAGDGSIDTTQRIVRADVTDDVHTTILDLPGVSEVG